MTILLITHDIGEAVSLSDRIVVFTKRPARLAHLVDVPLGGQRDVTRLRTTDAYQRTYEDVWRRLWDQIEAAA